MSERTKLLLGATLFFGIFFVRYLFIDSSLYQFRDDGIITLSHAKNWIDYGFIGVNPSGGILEGYSTPLQFLLFSIAYLLIHVHYAVFSTIVASLCTLGMAVASMKMFEDKKYGSIGISFLFAMFLAFQSSFIEWHGSGMENPLTHVFFLSSVGIFFKFLRNGKIDHRWLILPFLAMLARIDSIFHIFPVLLIFSILWQRQEKNSKGFQFSILVVCLWGAFQIVRRLYFGSFMPNTASAQNISLGLRLLKLSSFDSQIWAEGFSLSWHIFKAHAGYFLFTLLFIPFVDFKNKYILLVWMSLSLILTGLVHPILFGPSRLDFARTNSHIPIFIFLLISGIFFSLKAKQHQKIMLSCLVLVGSLIYINTYHSPYYLCCDTTEFQKTHDLFRKISTEQNIYRPTVANPDLGVVSWSKDMNVLDLGMLGSPILAATKDHRVVSDYIFDHVAPDLIESHEIWSCLHYFTIFMDPRFKSNYLVVSEKFIQFDGDCAGKALPTGVWIRKDILQQSKSSERIFLDQLQKNLNVDSIKSELESCQVSKDCAYVARTVYRFIPELKKMGIFEDVLGIFSKFPTTNDVDWYLLKGSVERNLDQKALRYLNKITVN